MSDTTSYEERLKLQLAQLTEREQEVSLRKYDIEQQLKRIEDEKSVKIDLGNLTAEETRQIRANGVPSIKPKRNYREDIVINSIKKWKAAPRDKVKTFQICSEVYRHEPSMDFFKKLEKQLTEELYFCRIKDYPNVKIFQVSDHELPPIDTWEAYCDQNEHEFA